MKRAFLLGLLSVLFAVRAQAACVIDGSAGTPLSSNTFGSSFSISIPSSHPSGDVLIAALGTAWSGTNPADQPVSSGSAFTLQYCSSASAGANICFYTRAATGSDASSYTWTTTHSVMTGGQMISLKGCNTTTPVDSGTTTTNTCFSNASTSATVSCTAPAATLANAGDAVIAAAFDNDQATSCSSTVSWGAVGGYTVESTGCAGGGNSNFGGNFGWGTVWYQAFASAGSTGTFASTWADSSANNVGILSEGIIAIAPAAATSTNGAVILMNKADSLNELALNLTAHASQAWFMP